MAARFEYNQTDGRVTFPTFLVVVMCAWLGFCAWIYVGVRRDRAEAAADLQATERKAQAERCRLFGHEPVNGFGSHVVCVRGEVIFDEEAHRVSPPKGSAD